MAIAHEQIEFQFSTTVPLRKDYAETASFRPLVTRIKRECPGHIIYRKGDSMKGQVQSIFFAVAVAALVATLVPFSAPAAQIRECKAAVPAKAQGHWSWRLIDGRKCWYSGKTVIAKSMLRWPAAVPAQAKAADPAQVQAKAVTTAPVSIIPERRSDPMDARAQMTDDADSFEQRWQSRARGL